MIKHGVKSIDSAAFDRANSQSLVGEWYYHDSKAYWQERDGTMFYFTDIHANAEEFENLRPTHTKSGPKSNKEEHVARALAAMTHMTGKITLERVTERVVQSFNGERGHGEKTVAKDISDTVKEFKSGQKR